MNSRPYTSDNYPILKSWWEDHGWGVVPEELLPQNGFIVWKDSTPVVSGFLYLTDSRFAICDWILSSKDSSKEDRDQALNILLDSLMDTARTNNKSTIYTMTNHPALLERYQSKGFILADKGMTSLIRRLN